MWEAQRGVAPRVGPDTRSSSTDPCCRLDRDTMLIGCPVDIASVEDRSTAIVGTMLPLQAPTSDVKLVV